MSSLKKSMLVVVAIVFISGCASKKHVTESSFMSPEIGNIATKGVGENLVMQGTGILVLTLVILEDAKIGMTTIKKGEYPFDAENSARIKFEKMGQEIYLDKERKVICVSKKECGDTNLKYKLDMKLVGQSPDSFQQTLLYNGKIGNRITLGYREFVGGAARAAFSNEASYDLSESTIVGYKGARIEIIKATNTDITYRFISGFKE